MQDKQNRFGIIHLKKIQGDKIMAKMNLGRKILASIGMTAVLFLLFSGCATTKMKKERRKKFYVPREGEAEKRPGDVGHIPE